MNMNKNIKIPHVLVILNVLTLAIAYSAMKLSVGNTLGAGIFYMTWLGIYFFTLAYLLRQ